jgi:hypothetical protein
MSAGWQKRGRWGASMVASFASIWALDVSATAVGVLTVASGVLDGASRGLIVGLLAVSYVGWGAGLRANLIVNWQLLAETGLSTNVLSKACYELAERRRYGERVARLATAFGYVITEIAKEAPYYTGALGTMVLSDAVDSTDALVFLAGANIGAAIYEYGIAGLTHAYLNRRAQRLNRCDALRTDTGASYAAFEVDWVPRDYLTDYYDSVQADERATIAFFVDSLRHATPGTPVLLFGVGPTMHHVFLTAVAATEIHLAEYLPNNLSEIERWIQRAPDAHNWRPFVERTLECEGVVCPTHEQVRDREELTRAKVTSLLAGDARLPNPLGVHGAAPYDTVISAYCADSATADVATWERYMRHIGGLVKPGGLLITAALRHSTGYNVGARTFPSACVGESDLIRALAPEFDWDDGLIQVRDLPTTDESHGYASIMLARVRRRCDESLGLRRTLLTA